MQIDFKEAASAEQSYQMAMAVRAALNPCHRTYDPEFDDFMERQTDVWTLIFGEDMPFKS